MSYLQLYLQLLGLVTDSPLSRVIFAVAEKHCRPGMLAQAQQNASSLLAAICRQTHLSLQSGHAGQ